MATRRSAGILLYRVADDGDVEVLLAHMGGPFWSSKDVGAWTLPKGEPDDGEHPLAAARREFAEEFGLPAPDGEPIALGELRQSGGKIVTAWAIEGDFDPDAVVPGTFEMEWPPRSGRRAEFPEVDRVAWLDLDAASRLMVAGQRPLLDRLRDHLDASDP